MKKIHGIIITKDTMVSGTAVVAGDELYVPADISYDDAALLLKMGTRATEIKKEAEDEPEGDGENVPVNGRTDNIVQLLEILDKKAADIESAISEKVEGELVISDEGLALLYKAEEDGNTRKNVIAIFDAEIKGRGLNKEALLSDGSPED